MSGLDDLSTAIDAFVQQAQNSTAEVSVSEPMISNQKLIADVKVTNKAGHRLPSGVGFRRAFLEFRVVDNDTGKTVWCSGCTNELGVIMNGAAAMRGCGQNYSMFTRTAPSPRRSVIRLHATKLFRA